ncbi:PDZ domain-containing protein [Streptomyces sp. NA04227]|uniref:PDZ domain-containing protein n=1 Tax=Streptomyces sp. NA04227 TaxID=2742136 RepID=UPI00159095B4|nr:PDZ domain-containing protein [Streptomyces sp. NA04227]QKW09917.1 PDZ domain-containing protein [Streptomyces sp. NA04227]
MEQTALRPKPMPGSEKARARKSGGRPGGGGGHRPGPARRRRRRLITLLVGLTVAVGLVLSGVGLGTVSATVIGMSKLADMQKSGGAPPGGPAQGQAPADGRGKEAPGQGAAPAAPAKAGDEPRAERGKDKQATLGIEAVDAPGGGALLVGVHVPGPGYTAGLVRGDVLELFGEQRIGSAADLARAVAEAKPGRRVTLTVRHENGVRQPLSAIPGVMT